MNQRTNQRKSKIKNAVIELENFFCKSYDASQQHTEDCNVQKHA
jgi:hypothetical protein